MIDKQAAVCLPPASSVKLRCCGARMYKIDSCSERSDWLDTERQPLTSSSCS